MPTTETDRFEVRQLELRSQVPFVTARAGSSVWHSVVVEVREEGLTGRGEAAPRDFYDETPERTAQEVSRWLETHGPLIGSDPAELGELGETSRAAQCAVDMALHDLDAQKAGLALWQHLAKRYGLTMKALPVSSYTIGLDRTRSMARRAGLASQYPILKVKLGRDKPLLKLTQIRAATEAELRVDGNTAWSAEETLELAGHFAKLGVTLLEQPLGRGDHEGFALLGGRLPMPLWADESLVDARDLEALTGHVDGINLKLSKCGGLYESVQLLKAARERGIGVMIGCFLETSLGITAGAALAPFVDHVDLDGALLLARDPYRGLEIPGGRLHLPNAHGIGVQPR